MTEWPEVDRTRCQAIGDCVRVCPVACLEMSGEGPRLVRPADCLACALCVMVCPTGAVRMAPEVEDSGEEPSG